MVETVLLSQSKRWQKKKKAKSDVYTRNNCSQFSYYEKWDPEQKMRHSGKTGLFI